MNHINCSACKKVLTYLNPDDKNEVLHIPVFEISRSKHKFYADEGEIEDNTEEKNVKMLIYLCEWCFVNVLNQSDILGKQFYNKQTNGFIY